MKMDRRGDRKNWVKWFMDFLNADLRTFSRMEEGRLAGDIGLLLASQKYSKDPPPGGLIFEEGSYPGQPRSSEDKEFMLVWRDYMKSGPQALDIGGLQDHLRVFFSELMSNVQRVRAGSDNMLLGSVFVPTTVFLRVGPTLMESRQESSVVDNMPVTLTFAADTDQNTLLLFFIKTLEGAPLNSLHSCDECGKWFIQLSKKKKRFCSGRCAARSGMRDGRKQRQREAESNEAKKIEYQKELEEKADRAHDAYDAKMRKITNNSNVKVERRPIKYKKRED
jgi:hypothetical protein